MQAHQRQLAPGALRLIQVFVNTKDIEASRDELDTPERLHIWLAKHDLLMSGDVVSEADLQRALELREGLRMLLLANNERAVEPDAVAILNRAVHSARLMVRFGSDGQARLDAGTVGFEGALARLLAIVFAAMVEGTWARLKACRNNACRWVFYDASKNQGGAWCSMAICGSRMKARAYRRRQRGQTPAAMDEH
jgi:predicted RNA-binding Zn ribbon-like protein